MGRHIHVIGIGAGDPDYMTVPSIELSNGFWQPPNFAAGQDSTYFPGMTTGSTGVPFITCGVNLTTTSPDFIIGNLVLMYHDNAAFVG